MGVLAMGYIFLLASAGLSHLRQTLIYSMFLSANLGY